ncbi:B12-binding domain-containing radical SAM protein [Candidatus Pacearchaeota archaeon]|nr:B12-binding domain-containing radical SAM protein [Candidatus Pacearchaeota archaeon]
MKILLAVPPFYRFLGSHGNSVHLGLGYLSAMLRREGHEVAQVNFDYLPSNDYANQKGLFEENEHYKERINDPYSTVWVDVGKTLVEFQPDVVGINVFSSSVRQAEIIAKECKRLEKEPVVIVGGPMPTIAPELLTDKHFDIMVGGQAESCIVELEKWCDIKKMMDVPFTVECIPPQDLNALPFPDRDNYLNSYRYLNLSPIITSRGCKFNCKGCAHRKMGGSYRHRSAGNVVNEIIYLQTKDVKFLRFFDDSFSTDRGRVIELCKCMRFNVVDVDWLAETRIDLLDPELLKIMHEAGCVRLKVGVESGSKRVLKWLRKGMKVEQMVAGCKMIKDSGIGLTINTMFGMPNETNKDLQKTIDLCKKIDADYVTVSSYVPYPGSEVFKLVPEHRQKEYPYWTHTMRHPVLNDSLDQGLIDDLLNLNEGLKRV